MSRKKDRVFRKGPLPASEIAKDKRVRRAAQVEFPPASSNDQKFSNPVSTPLTPMLVQYLVGLCCLKWDPNAVDITIGDMVTDTAAGKKRDVDVTVTVAESSERSFAFKAYEVKREGAPLDVTEVEALCLKLIDMPSITHRAIVSTSGFTSGAQKKAARHGVKLYVLRPCEVPPVSVPGVMRVGWV